MIDTIKLGIPLSRYQFRKLIALLERENRYQWVKHNSLTGDILFVRRRGLMDIRTPSWHREIYWDIPETYRENETFLVVELSLPKFWYGHNISLLYGYFNALKELRRDIEKQLHLRLEIVNNWHLFRLDCCYTWYCQTQQNAELILESLQRLNYPRKKPHIYPKESLLFAGRTYSLKFYLKLPEFRKNDLPALKKAGAKIEWLNYLEEKAKAILRCEATLRRKYLKRKGLLTVGDLLQPTRQFIANWDLIENHPEIETDNNAFLKCIYIITSYEALNNPSSINKNGSLNLEGNYLKDGDIFKAPALIFDLDGDLFEFKGGSITIKFTDVPTRILQLFLDKFIGDYKGMDSAEKVKDKLLENYKSVKAARLLSFWLFVQRFGTAEAKEIYGRDSFYDAKRALKAVGINLLENSVVIDASNKFFDKFRVAVPSSETGNETDDFRDSENVLNHRPNETSA